MKTNNKFKKYGVNCIVDGKGNIIIVRQGSKCGVSIDFEKSKKIKSLVTNFNIIGWDFKRKRDKIKYMLLIELIGILYPETMKVFKKDDKK